MFLPANIIKVRSNKISLQASFVNYSVFLKIGQPII